STTAQIQSTTVRIQSTTVRIQSTTAQIQSTTVRIQSTTVRIQSTTAQIQSTTTQIQSTIVRIQYRNLANLLLLNTKAMALPTPAVGCPKGCRANARIEPIQSVEVAQEAFEVFDLRSHHVTRMVELMEKYADLPMDMADASLEVPSRTSGTRTDFDSWSTRL
ncbi:MAG: hypothetical protein V7K41_14000, partial [Nostoc sp.]